MRGSGPPPSRPRRTTSRFRIAALSLDDYAAGLAYMAGLAHDAGQSAYDLFKNYPQSPT